MNQAVNWKQVSLIEVISITGHRLLLFVILKGKKWKNNQYFKDMKRTSCISLSKNS